MTISSIFSVAAALLAAGQVRNAAVQVRDNVTTTQEAFTTCLHRFVQTSVEGRKTAEAFNTELPQQCTAQEQAYRAAMIRRDTSARISRTDAEQSANEEVAYARQNTTETFTDASRPR